MSADTPEPFHTAPGSSSHTRRLLLVSYHFSPDPAIGALRWHRFAALAAERGWGLDVIMRSPNEISRPDADLLAELPSGTRLFGVPSERYWLDPFVISIGRLRRSHRRTDTASGNIGGADAEPGSLRRLDARWIPPNMRVVRRAYSAWSVHARDRSWVRRAVKVGTALIKHGAGRDPHAAVVSCGPPHMVHVAGMRLSLQWSLPHVVDLRDPWSLVERLPEHLVSPLYFSLARMDERRTFKAANLIIANTAPAATALRAMYPALHSRIMCVVNGFDATPIPNVPRPKRFTIVYAGTIYLDRDPRPLLSAAATVISEQALTPEQFGVDFIGAGDTFDGIPLSQLAQNEGIAQFVRFLPRIPRRQLQAELAKAAVLAVLPQDSEMAIPGKVFEYLLFDAWVLAIAKNRSATGRLICELGGDVVPPGDTIGLTRILNERFAQYARGDFPVKLARDERYSRRNQAALLFDAMEIMLHQRGYKPPS